MEERYVHFRVVGNYTKITMYTSYFEFTKVMSFDLPSTMIIFFCETFSR